MKREYQDTTTSTTTTTTTTTTSTTTASNSTGGGGQMSIDPVDEQLAVLGYQVRNSDMADVAQRLEQLEMMVGQEDDFDFVTHLSSETAHYNPSDLASWLQSMLSEAPNFQLPQFPSSSSSFDPLFNDDVDDDFISYNHHYQNDLTAIPGGAICSGTTATATATANANKRLKPSTSTSTSTSSSSSSSVLINEMISPSPNPSPSPSPLQIEQAKPLIVDSQENGIRLVHTLMACAEAVQANNMRLAEALVKQIGVLAVSQPGAMRKVATYFAEALARRIYGLCPPLEHSFESSFSDLLEMHFYETCPYLKFAHFTANQAILEAFEGKSLVHVIDFSLKQGMQWPALMQALALRPGGPPAFRLTGIGPPQPDNSDALQQVGLKLAQLADTIHVKFEFRGFVANSLADLEPSILDIRPDESVAVNSVFELHRLLSRPGALEKVLGSVTAMRPHIVTVVEQEATHNGPGFVERFNESLHYYSTLFDSLEGSVGMSGQDLVMSEAYLGRQICNVVACEGVDRVERHETLSQWRVRMESAGFRPVHIGSNAFKQASMLLSLFGGVDGYRVEENIGCLMLGWHTRPLIATSAWRPGTESVTDSG